MTYYFEVLPLHPGPKPMESLSSYLCRLAELNRIMNFNELRLMLMPKSTDKNYFRDFVDIPPLSVKDISLSTFQDELTILGATFYPLMINLGRRTHPHSIGHFLKGALAKTFRFCPHCLIEDPYYRIYWRFLDIKVCPIHWNRLLDQCPNCHKNIPLMSPKFKIGICPFCNGSLADCCQDLIISDSLRQQNEKIFSDLSYLLTFHNNFMSTDDYAKVIGDRLRYVRLKMEISQTKISIISGMCHGANHSIEHGRTSIQGGGTFNQLKDILNIYGISFKQLITGENIPEIDPTIFCPKEKNSSEKTLLNKQTTNKVAKPTKKLPRPQFINLAQEIRDAKIKLRNSGQKVTREKVCQLIGISSINPHGNQEVIFLLQQIQRENLLEKRKFEKAEEKEIFEKVENALNFCQNNPNVKVTMLKICLLVGKSPKKIKKYSSVKNLISNRMKNSNLKSSGQGKF